MNREITSITLVAMLTITGKFFPAMKKRTQSLLLISILIGLTANLLLAIPPTITEPIDFANSETLGTSPLSNSESFKGWAENYSFATKDGGHPVNLSARAETAAPPTGYFVNIDQPSINLSNQTAISFTISDAEVGATYNYTFTSDGVGGGGSGGSGGTVSGSGTITAIEQQVTGIDLTSLDDGTVTLTLTLTSGGETGDPATDTESKDTVEPAGYTVSIDQGLINSANEDAVSFTIDNAEVGATVNYTFTSSGGAGTVSGTDFVNSLTEQVTGIDLSGLPDGIITLSVTLTDVGNNTGDPAEDSVNKDATAPTGYTVNIDQNPINASNANAVSFTFAGAEVGSSYDYSFTSSGGGGSVTGSGTIGSATEQIANIDLSGLADGTITLTVTLTDTNSNTGDPATDTAIKDTVAPSGYDVTIDQSPILAANDEAVSFTFSGAEVGATYNYTFTSDGGGGSVTGSGTISTATDQITGIDLSGLADGTITLTVTLTDSNGNLGSEAVDTTIKDASVPEDYSVSIDQESIVATNQSSISFTFTGAEVGATFNYTFTSDGGETEVVGTGTIATATDQVTGIDLSSLEDGTVTLSATLTNNVGNTGPVATDSVLKDVNAPTGYTVSIDQDEINGSNQTALSFTFSSAEVDATYTYSISSSGGGTEVTGTGIIATPADQITGIDVSNLNDGLLTLSATLTDEAGNTGEPATSTVIKVTLSVEFTNSESSGLESQSTASIQVELSAVSDEDVVVEYTVSGTATGSGTDYTLADGNVTILAGNETTDIVISDIVDDNTAEGEETIIITLSDPQNASLGANTVHTYTILDNDGQITQTIIFPPIEDQRLSEGQLELEATGGDSGEPLTFSIVTSPPSGVASLSNGTIIFEGVGNVTVTASQAGNDLYLPADDVTRSFSIFSEEFLLPTLFTPNNDGFNDDLLLRGAARVQTIEFTVFDRAGNQVYTANSIDELSQRGWDGTTNGVYQPQGTYIWVVSGNLIDGSRILINGKQKGVIALAR